MQPLSAMEWPLAPTGHRGQAASAPLECPAADAHCPRCLRLSLSRPLHPGRFFALVLQQLPTIEGASACSEWLAGSESSPGPPSQGPFQWNQCLRMRSGDLWLASQHALAFDLRFAGSALAVTEAAAGSTGGGAGADPREGRTCTIDVVLQGTLRDLEAAEASVRYCLLSDAEFAEYCEKHGLLPAPPVPRAPGEDSERA